MSDSDYTTILLEEIRGQNKAVLEYVTKLPIMKNDIAELKDDVATLKSDITVIKTVVTDLDHQVADRERAIQELKVA